MIMFQSGHNVESIKILPIFFFHCLVTVGEYIMFCIMYILYSFFLREDYLPFWKPGVLNYMRQFMIMFIYTRFLP